MNKIVRIFINKLPDWLYISLQYKRILGEYPNLYNPQTFNEKLQWIKLHDRDKRYTQMADKYAVREYIEGVLGKKYLVPIYGVYEKAEDIDWDKIPNKFVMKCTHDGGSVIVCRNRDSLDKARITKKLNQALKRNAFLYAREWPYKNIKPKIIVEKYLDNGDTKGLIDYKFYCFAGEPKYLYISQGLENHTTARMTFYDISGNRAPFQRIDYELFETDPVLPLRFQDMVKCAAKVAENIGNNFVRVDFYCINNRIYFSEITFTPVAGYMKILPEVWDKKLGDLIQLL